MSARLYSVPGQTDLLTIRKAFIILFLLSLWEKGTPSQFSKQISKLSFQLSVQVCSLLNKSEAERPFLEGGKRGVTRDYPQEHLVVMRDEKSLLL